VLAEDEEIDVVCSSAPGATAFAADAALEVVRAGGTIIVLALYDEPISLAPTVLVPREIRLQGSIATRAEDLS